MTARSSLPAALLLLLLVGQGCGVGIPKVVYVARHGQTEWNRVSRFQGDPPLDPVGAVNRVSLWHLLKDRPLKAVYSSQRLRARQTAALIAKEKRRPVQARAELNEIEPGIFEGICYGWIAKPNRRRPRHADCFVNAKESQPERMMPLLRRLSQPLYRHSLDKGLPLGESFNDVARRTRPFVDRLSRHGSGDEILIVGHLITNRVLLHQLLDWPLELTARLPQGNDQVYRIERDAHGPPTLFLYSPQTGWRRCTRPTKPFSRRLDCHPPRRKRAPAQPPTKEAPAPSDTPAAPTPAPDSSSPK